jgi:hypothetical protein
MALWRKNNGGLGSDSTSDPRLKFVIDVDRDSPEVIGQKIDLMRQHDVIDRTNKTFSDRRVLFKTTFYSTFFITLLSAAWSFYVLLTLADHSVGTQEVAKFVISTVISAALASGIGLIATQPRG